MFFVTCLPRDILALYKTVSLFYKSAHFNSYIQLKDANRSGFKIGFIVLVYYAVGAK